ncbi:MULTISPECIES: hypothetical protein [unclassified Bacillus (in: firmicutes)]|uniref:hypothetical protein n=1 Tax=unclassified Bacillus (in: firmicutes) TaxID=185979 RepID=UPI000E35F37E|nr:MULTISPECIES: hypothetical protein [unclassified Bacillus (in: firmicutes)]AXR14633.1 hypothetical protein DOS87_00045 [Bacillus sp. CR71]AXR20366.1 hypothetical protein DPQ26_00040 [Bacillus sp. E25]
MLNILLSTLPLFFIFLLLNYIGQKLSYKNVKVNYKIIFIISLIEALITLLIFIYGPIYK